MNDEEIVHFIVIFFALGMVFKAYYPSLFTLVLFATAAVGAIYFILGITARLISGITGGKYTWAKDWWHGLTILLMVGLVFGRMDLAVGVVYWFLSGLVKLFIGVMTAHI